MPADHRGWCVPWAVSCALAPLVLSTLTVAPATAAPVIPVAPTTRLARPLVGSSAPHRLADRKLVGALRSRPSVRQPVFVQLSGTGAADTAAAALRAGQSASEARLTTRSRRRGVQQTAAAVVTAARAADRSTAVLFQVANAVPGVALTATTETLRALATRPDVVRISPLVPKKVTNSSVAQLTRALSTWKSPGVTGRGVRIGIIDSGIDYTHADFGGPGTVAAWKTAHARSAGPFTPTAKVVGGYDFVGDAYDPASVDPAHYLPQPDGNPLDCEGHGTHVAGTAAGSGVTATGSTFRGRYARLSGATLDGMRVGPGMAPQASLYALKIFGCSGSTDAVIPALDWALDPNGDGSFADHLDVVNLSLGADYTTADDPENQVIDDLAAHGVLSVVSAGNAGDLTDAAGAPGSAARAVSVASSVDAYQLQDGLRVLAPAAVAGIASGQRSLAYDWAAKPDLTGAVVPLTGSNTDGCDELSDSDAAAVAGRVAWLVWDDSAATRRCGSTARVERVAAAGAVGAVLTSGADVFGSDISGSALIPAVQLSRAETGRLGPAALAGTLRVTFSARLRAASRSVTPGITDTLSTFSSRGSHGAPGVVKPDVTAVGDTVASAAVGTGSGVAVESGTSMASPVAAGIAALVLQAHPSWSTEQVKAALMNTAGHDLYTRTDHRGDRYGPARVGAGRIDARAAVTTRLLAYSTAKRGVVSASFGVVEVPATSTRVTRTQTVRIRNKGSHRAAVRVSYQAVVKQPGVAYRVSPASVSIKARSSVTVTVTLTATTAQLRHSIDPTMQPTQADPQLEFDRARQFVSDASGRLLVKQTGATTLRVPVYGAAKPVSVTSVSDGTTPGGDPALLVSGTGFNQGSGSAAFSSKLAVLDLGYTSRRLPFCVGFQTTGCVLNDSARSGDLQYVGAGATPGLDGSRADGWVYFGLSTFGNWATVGNSLVPYVDLDTTGDGQPDYEASVQNEPGTDLLTTFVVDLATGNLVDVEPVNFLDGDSESNVFDSNTLVLPIAASALGIRDTTTSFPLSYTVGTNSLYAGPDAGDIDSTPAVSFDAVAPKIALAGPLYRDVSGVAIGYRLSASTPSATALLLHLHGRSGSRAEVRTLTGRSGVSPGARGPG